MNIVWIFMKLVIIAIIVLIIYVLWSQITSYILGVFDIPRQLLAELWSLIKDTAQFVPDTVGNIFDVIKGSWTDLTAQNAALNTTSWSSIL